VADFAAALFAAFFAPFFRPVAALSDGDCGEVNRAAITNTDGPSRVGRRFAVAITVIPAITAVWDDCSGAGLERRNMEG
jgi:hypothetical protein